MYPHTISRSSSSPGASISSRIISRLPVFAPRCSGVRPSTIELQRPAPLMSSSATHYGETDTKFETSKKYKNKLHLQNNNSSIAPLKKRMKKNTHSLKLPIATIRTKLINKLSTLGVSETWNSNMQKLRVYATASSGVLAHPWAIKKRHTRRV